MSDRPRVNITVEFLKEEGGSLKPTRLDENGLTEVRNEYAFLPHLPSRTRVARNVTKFSTSSSVNTTLGLENSL